MLKVISTLSRYLPGGLKHNWVGNEINKTEIFKADKIQFQKIY